MDIKITEKNYDFINTYIRISPKYYKNAQLIFKDKLRVHSRLKELNIENGVNWSHKDATSENTFQLYLHTLNIVAQLTKTYLESKEEKYIRKAKEIILDWINYNYDNTNQSKFVWYDHTVSSRLQNLLYFQSNVPKEIQIDEKLYNEIVREHIEFLMNPLNYVENNHGIMMDKALLLASQYLVHEEDREKVLLLTKGRTEKSILKDYSYLGVHLENSPDYHIMVTKLLLEIVDLLKSIESPLKKSYVSKLESSQDYISLIMNYNKEIPMIGDTSHGIARGEKISKDFVDYEAGIGVVNNNRLKSTLIFNCGYNNTTHKHHDDLSFILSMKNEQIFVDSGKYNYVKNSPIRQHIISPLAHTTILPEKKIYSLSKSDKILLKDFYTHANYKMISGCNEAYDGLTLQRNLIVIKESIIVILDHVFSDKQNVYLQNFVLNPDIVQKRIGKGKFRLTTPKNNEYILQEHSKIKVSLAQFGKEKNAFISKKFNETEDTTRIEFKRKLKSGKFITTFSPQNFKIEDVSFEQNFLNLRINNLMYKIYIEN